MQIRGILPIAGLVAALAAPAAAHAGTTVTNPTSFAGTSERVVYAKHTDDFRAPLSGLGNATWSEVVSATVATEQEPTHRSAVVSARAPD